MPAAAEGPIVSENSGCALDRTRIDVPFSRDREGAAATRSVELGDGSASAGPFATAVRRDTARSAREGHFGSCARRNASRQMGSPGKTGRVRMNQRLPACSMAPRAFCWSRSASIRGFIAASM